MKTWYHLCIRRCVSLFEKAYDGILEEVSSKQNNLTIKNTIFLGSVVITPFPYEYGFKCICLRFWVSLIRSKSVSFDTKLKLFKNAVQSGVIWNGIIWKRIVLFENSEDRDIWKRSHSISVSKRARAKDMWRDKYWVMETPTLSFWLKQRGPG